MSFSLHGKPSAFLTTIDRLIAKHYEEFPQLHLVSDHCITKPAVKADLWRLLFLYEYGGIYADLNTKPMPFEPSTTLLVDDEMYALGDISSRPAFSFMGSMPRHPLPFLTLHQALHELLFIPDTGDYCPAITTGKAMYCHSWDYACTWVLYYFSACSPPNVSRSRRSGEGDAVVYSKSRSRQETGCSDWRRLVYIPRHGWTHCSERRIQLDS